MASWETRRKQTGRIHPHERECDNEAPIIGEDLTIDNYDDEVIDTVGLGKEDKTRKDYRRRIMRIVKWIEENHPAYYNLGCRDVGEYYLRTKNTTTTITISGI